MNSRYFYNAVAFSPDGGRLATGWLDDPYAAHLGRRHGQAAPEARPGKRRIADARLQRGRPASSRFQASSLVASLWDVGTGARIGPALTSGGRRAEIDLSPDGRRLLVTHADGRGAVWDVDPESLAERACRLANRRLTLAEWEEFLPGRSYDPACGRLSRFRGGSTRCSASARPAGRGRRDGDRGGRAASAARRPARA